MSTQKKRDFISLEEFTDYEASLEHRAEFLDGHIMDMAGGTIPHSLISSNLIGILYNSLDASDCKAHNGDLKVYVKEANAVVYPDCMVVCGEYLLDKSLPNAICNPLWVAEVVSPSTALHDRNTKFGIYRHLPSVREYVIVEQHLRQVDVYSLQPDGQWLFNSYSGTEGDVEFPALGLRVPISAVYRGVD